MDPYDWSVMLVRLLFDCRKVRVELSREALLFYELYFTGIAQLNRLLFTFGGCNGAYLLSMLPLIKIFAKDWGCLVLIYSV